MCLLHLPCSGVQATHMQTKWVMEIEEYIIAPSPLGHLLDTSEDLAYLVEMGTTWVNWCFMMVRVLWPTTNHHKPSGSCLKGRPTSSCCLHLLCCCCHHHHGHMLRRQHQPREAKAAVPAPVVQLIGGCIHRDSGATVPAIASAHAPAY